MTRIVSGPLLTGRVISKNGVPMGGVLVTPSKSVFTDPELTAAVTTMTTDGNGTFTAYAAPGIYAFTVNTTDALPVESIEVLSPDQGTTSGGGGGGGASSSVWLSASDSRVAAVADGSTDNGPSGTNTIAKAATILGAAGGVLYFPPGIYQFTSQPAAIPSNIRIIGAGKNSTVLRKNYSGAGLLRFEGSSTSSRCQRGGVEDIQLCGTNGHTGALLTATYADHLNFDRVWFNNNPGSAVVATELWDSYFTHCEFEWCGTTTYQTGAAVVLLGSATDSTNVIGFTECRWESFPGHALWIGNNGGSHPPYRIYLNECKMESANVGNLGFIDMTNDVTDVHIRGMYLAADGFAGGFTSATAPDLINLVAGGFCTLRGISVYVNNNTARSVIRSFPGGGNYEIEEVWVNAVTSLGVGIIEFAGGNPTMRVRNVRYKAGTGGAVPVYSGTTPSNTVLVDTTTYAPLSDPKLRWAPPALTTPTVLNVTTSYNVLDTNTDYIVNLPTAGLKVSGGLQLVGGRNVVLVGGLIEIPASADPATDTNLRAFFADGATGTVHVEGVLCRAAAGGIINEGFDFRCPSAIVQVQNCRVENLTRSDIQHNDVLQTWGGVGELRVDRLTGSSDYQGVTLKADFNSHGPSTLSRVNIIGLNTSGIQQYLWTVPNTTRTGRVDLVDFYISPGTGQTIGNSVWPKFNDATYPLTVNADTVSGEYRADANIFGVVRAGTPPSGDFVPSGSVGIGYVPPGYQSSLAAALAGKASTTDPRLSDARTPTAHASTHLPAGTDPIIEFDVPTTFTGNVGTSNTTVGVTNQARYMRFVKGGTLSKIGLGIGAQSGNISVAVYRNSGVGSLAAPGTRLATSGAVACPAVGYQEISLGATVTVNPGDWLGLSADNATASFAMFTSAAVAGLAAGRSYIQSTAHPCPATPASLTANTNGFQAVGVA